MRTRRPNSSPSTAAPCSGTSLNRLWRRWRRRRRHRERPRLRRWRCTGVALASSRMHVLSTAPSSPQVHWRRSRVFDRGVAAVCCQLVREAPAAALSQLDETEETRARPLGLNTVQLLKTCSAALGLGAHSAMRIAEGLYLDGRNRTLRDCTLTKSQRDCTLTKSQRDCTLASGSRTHDCD